MYFLYCPFSTETFNLILKNKSVQENYNQFCLKHLSSTLIYLPTLDMSLSSKIISENETERKRHYNCFTQNTLTSFALNVNRVLVSSMKRSFINNYTKNVHHESKIFLYSSVNNKPVYCFLYMNIYISFGMLDWKAF